MSQDENKPDDFDFDFNAGNFSDDDNFDPFAEDGISLEKETPSDSGGISLDKEGEAESASLDDLPGPSSLLTGEAEAEELPEPEEEEEETDAKGKKKKKKAKKEKPKKEKKPKAEKKKKEKKPKEPGEKEPMGLGGALCLVFGFLLLLGLIAANVMLFMEDPKNLGVGASSVMYYAIGMDVIGLIGVVAVPFLFFPYRKDLDVFKVGLGLSLMAMSLGVIFLLTAWFRYDFAIKAPTSMPPTDIPVSAPPAPAAPAE